MTNLPPQTSQIFQFLSKGLFLSSNSHQTQRALFKATRSHEKELREYFLPLGFELCKGEGYYYFITQNSETLPEEHLEQIARFIEWLDFLKTFNPGFGPGKRFSIDEILNEVQENYLLKRKLNQLSLRGGQGKPIEKIRQLVRLMERQGFVEVMSESTETYLTLSAFSFLESWANKIKFA